MTLKWICKIAFLSLLTLSIHKLSLYQISHLFQPCLFIIILYFFNIFYCVIICLLILLKGFVSHVFYLDHDVGENFVKSTSH